MSSKYYDQNGCIIEVIRGFGQPPVFFSARGRHRVKSEDLPLRQTIDRAQQDLDEWAKAKGFALVLSDGPCGGCG
jgi:hypothetical protein